VFAVWAIDLAEIALDLVMRRLQPFGIVRA
jgi:hypothetical protein